MAMRQFVSQIEVINIVNTYFLYLVIYSYFCTRKYYLIRFFLLLKKITFSFLEFQPIENKRL